MAKEKILAVAFIDGNPNDHNDHFNPQQDTLIAAVIDTNNSNTIDRFDTVRFGDYPLNTDLAVDPNTGGTTAPWINSEVIISRVGTLGDGQVAVDVVNQDLQALGTVAWHVAPDGETFETRGLGFFESRFTDFFSAPTDAIEVQATPNQPPAGPGEPALDVHDVVGLPGDQPFLDVFIA
jgi:hypothetical protein